MDSAIIVEGPDGSGKTTLAKKLCDEFHRVYRRPPPALLSSTVGPSQGLEQWWSNELAGTPKYHRLGVYDRCFYISDPIYQQAQVDRDLLVHPRELSRGIARLWSIEPILIFCLPDFDAQLANVRHSGRPQLEGVSAQALSKIWNMYWAQYAWCSQALYDNVMIYDYTVEEEWERLKDKLHALA